MDRKLNYCRFELCKKPHEKRLIRREITLFLKVSKMAIFLQNGKGRDQGEIFKNRRFFGRTSEG